MLALLIKMMHGWALETRKTLKRTPLLFSSLVSLLLIGSNQNQAEAQQVNYKLLNGDTISGELQEDESTQTIKIIIHPQLGRVELDTSLIQTGDIKAWKNSFELGFDGANTSLSGSAGYSLDAKTEYRDKTKELVVESDYDFKETSKKGTKKIIGVNKGSARIRFDRFLGNSWASYFSKNYEVNGLNKIGRHNIISSVGVAYKIINTQFTKLRFSLGPSFEWTGGGNECSSTPNCGVINPGGILGAKYTRKLNKNLELILENNYRSRFIAGISTSNRLVSAIKYYPIPKSNFYTSLSYENHYDEIKYPNYEQYYKIKLGTTF